MMPSLRRRTAGVHIPRFPIVGNIDDKQVQANSRYILNFEYCQYDVYDDIIMPPGFDRFMPYSS